MHFEYSLHAEQKFKERRISKSEVGENQMKVRYDQDSDILYLLIKEGDIEDTIEVSEDLFVEYDEKKNIAGIELWRVRRNLFGEILKYLNTITELDIMEKGVKGD